MLVRKMYLVTTINFFLYKNLKKRTETLQLIETHTYRNIFGGGYLCHCVNFLGK